MDSQGSVTILLRQLSDPAAAQRLYERYVQQLVALVNRKLAGVPRAVVDGPPVGAIDTAVRLDQFSTDHLTIGLGV